MVSYLLLSHGARTSFSFVKHLYFNPLIFWNLSQSYLNIFVHIERELLLVGSLAI